MPHHTFCLVHVPADSDRRLCKVHTPQGTAEIDDLPYLCNFEELAVPDVASLLGVFDRLAGDATTCLLRARLRDGVEQPCRRIYKTDVRTGDEATLEDVPRSWVLIDLDSVPCPEGLDFKAEPHRAALYMRNQLPLEFRTAACVWRASSNAGLKEGIRLHLWFLLSAELDTPRLNHWLRNVACDKAVFRANQPHFTCDPTFIGTNDPMARRRGTLAGAPRVIVPAEIEQYEGDGKTARTGVPRAGGISAPDVDPIKAAALRRWEDARPFEDPGSSVRLECPACGSSDGIAVREDGRWNCHGGKHIDEAPHIGTYTGSVYVGHRIEFQEGLTPRDVVPWLKLHGYWGNHKLSNKFHGGDRGEASNTHNTDAKGAESHESTPDHLDSARAAAATMSALVTGDVKPSLREYERATAQLARAVKVVQVSPGKLADVAEELGRLLPHFLDEAQVRAALRDAAVRAPIAVALTAEHATDVINGALERGMKSAHRPRAARDEDEGPQLPLDEHGQPARCEATVYYWCTRPQILNAIALDDRAHRVVVIDVPPWWPEDDREFPRPLEDPDLSRIASYISARFGYAHASAKQVMQAIGAVAADRRWDPVEDYLDGLEWEGTDDEARELLALVPATLLGCDDTPYTRVVFMRWAIAGVQRTYDPGCQFREVLTLIGTQNMGKSKFFRLLCAAPEWFSDTVAADGSKDSRSGLDGKWIVEFAELDKHMRDDRTGAFKNYISTQVDSYRRAYAHVDMDVRRRCIFGASSNHEDLFCDPTGNTRFNVLTTRFIDAEGVLEFRDQIWAAAKHLYRAGEPSWLQGAERDWAAAIQAQHYDESSPEALIRELWDNPAPVALRAPGGVSRDNGLGFSYDEGQLDAQRRWQVLTTSQIRSYLLEQGCRVTGVDKIIRRVCRQAGMERGRMTRELPTIANHRGWGRPDCSLLVVSAD